MKTDNTFNTNNMSSLVQESKMLPLREIWMRDPFVVPDATNSRYLLFGTTDKPRREAEAVSHFHKVSAFVADNDILSILNTLPLVLTVTKVQAWRVLGKARFLHQ